MNTPRQWTKPVFWTAAIAGTIALVGRMHHESNLPHPWNWIIAFAVTFLAWAPVLAVVFRKRLFTRKALSGWIAAFILLISAFVLFRSVESWRGKRAWTTLQKELQAKGQTLAFSNVVPPTIPDEENFGMAPVFSPLFAYQTNSGLILPPPETEALKQLQQISMYCGKKTTDDKLEKNGDWIKQQPVNLAAWASFYRTSNSSNTPPLEPAAEVLRALKQFQPVIDKIRAASAERPHSRFPLPYEKGFFCHLDHAKVLENIVEVLRLRAVAYLALGSNTEAFEDVQLALRIADSLRVEPFSFSQWKRSKMLLTILQPIWEGLAGHKWSEDQLKTFQDELQGIDLLANSLTAARAEIFAQIDLCSFTVTPDRMKVEFDVKDWHERMLWLTFRVLYPSGWGYQNQVGIYRFYENHIAPLIDVEEHRVFREKWPNQEDFLNISHDPLLFIFIFPRTIETVDQLKEWAFLQTSFDQAALGCALERYRMAHGQFPEDLNTLTPDLVQKIQNDVMDEKRLRYKRSAEDAFILYSVGWNGSDELGRSGAWMSEHHSRIWPELDRGDWVWTYQAK